MRVRRLHVLLAVLGLLVVAVPFRAHLRRVCVAMVQRAQGLKTVEDRVAQYGAAARARLAPAFAAAGIAYPPYRAALIGVKDERRLEVWVAGADAAWRHLRDYPILGMSGKLGPKLREGDRQVPEGRYRVESLNPNSLYHLALRVDYPNADDRRRGRQDRRAELGGDIMIHGKDCSIGCLAMGDEAAEDLFVLAAETGIDRVSILLTPVDFRIRELPAKHPPLPAWAPELYAALRHELAQFAGTRNRLGSGVAPQ